VLHFLLRLLIDPELADTILGDLEEGRRRRAVRSPTRARVWFWGVALGIGLHLGGRRLMEGLMTGLTARLGLRGFGRELWQAGRSLLRTPVFSVVLVLILALGLGLNTAIFSVVHGVLFEPLPFQSPDRLVVVEGRQGEREPSRFGTSYLDFQDLRANQRTFDELATSAYWTFTVTGLDTPLRLVGNRVSGTFFSMLGVAPALGRGLDPDDDAAGADGVAVLSYGFWMRVFGGSPDVIGRALPMNGVSTRIVGVMPASFRYPAEDVELWTAMRGALDTVGRNGRFCVTIGRLRARGGDSGQHRFRNVRRASGAPRRTRRSDRRAAGGRVFRDGAGARVISDPWLDATPERSGRPRPGSGDCVHRRLLFDRRASAECRPAAEVGRSRCQRTGRGRQRACGPLVLAG
jgi:hypothetical protein